MRFTIGWLLILAILSFSCNDGKQKSSQDDKPIFKIIESNEEVDSLFVIQEISIPPKENWNYRGLELVKSERESYERQKAFNLKVKQNASGYAVVIIPKIKLNQLKSKYKISFIVKRGDIGNHLGLRLSGEAPQRLDVVFNTENGNVSEILKAGNFITNELIKMRPLENNWYQCIITAEINSNNINFYLGPTTGSRPIKSWESLSTNSKGMDMLLVPSSITFEEIE